MKGIHKMNKRIISPIEEILSKDERAIVMLCGIGNFLFKNAKVQYPDRVFDLGIMEQTAVGMAAGLASQGMIPFLYTWSPFLIERTYEQLKLDFGSQKLGANFLGLGGSYDLAAFGDSHYCPADVPILNQIKNMQIVVPGTEEEYQSLIAQAYDNGFPTYYRISSQQNKKTYQVQFGKANVIQTGTKATILVVGPILDLVIDIVKDYDVSVLYYTTVAPFDNKTLKEHLVGERVMICEPYNSGVLIADVLKVLSGRPVQIEQVGLEKEMLCELGSFQENLENFRLREEDIRMRLENLIAKLEAEKEQLTIHSFWMGLWQSVNRELLLM